MLLGLVRLLRLRLRLLLLRLAVLRFLLLRLQLLQVLVLLLEQLVLLFLQLLHAAVVLRPALQLLLLAALRLFLLLLRLNLGQRQRLVGEPGAGREVSVEGHVLWVHLRRRTLAGGARIGRRRDGAGRGAGEAAAGPDLGSRCPAASRPSPG